MQDTCLWFLEVADTFNQKSGAGLKGYIRYLRLFLYCVLFTYLRFRRIFTKERLEKPWCGWICDYHAEPLSGFGFEGALNSNQFRITPHYLPW